MIYGHRQEPSNSTQPVLNPTQFDPTVLLKANASASLQPWTLELHELEKQNIWILIGQMTNVQHPFLDVDLELAPDLRMISRDHGNNYNRGVIWVTAVPLVAKPLSAIHIVYTKDGQGKLLKNCKVGIVDSRRKLRVLARLWNTKDVAVELAKKQIWGINFYRNENVLVSLRETITLSCHNVLLPAIYVMAQD